MYIERKPVFSTPVKRTKERVRAKENVKQAAMMISALSVIFRKNHDQSFQNMSIRRDLASGWLPCPQTPKWITRQPLLRKAALGGSLTIIHHVAPCDTTHSPAPQPTHPSCAADWLGPLGTWAQISQIYGPAKCYEVVWYKGFLRTEGD